MKNQLLVIDNLERIEYLTIAYHSFFYIGNSSSGIYELPYLNIPIINIGDRQNGRGMSSNIINCNFNDIKKESDEIIRNRNNLLKNINYFYKIYNSRELFDKSIEIILSKM